MKEFFNDCTNSKTLELYNKFIHSPHCIGGMMYPAEEDAPESEIVEITFKHYMDIITVVFKAETQVDEVMLHVIGNTEEEDDMQYCGLVTVSRLVDLLESLPHIRDFMESEFEGGLLH